MGTLAYAFPLNREAAGQTTAHTGAFFSVFSIAAIAFLALGGARLPDRLGRRTTLALGTALVAAALVALHWAEAPAAIGLAMSLYGVGFAAEFPAACTLVVDRTRYENRGTAFGVYYALFSMGISLGAPVAGAVMTTPLGPYGTAVVVLACVALLRRHPLS